MVEYIPTKSTLGKIVDRREKIEAESEKFGKALRDEGLLGESITDIVEAISRVEQRGFNELPLQSIQGKFSPLPDNNSALAVLQKVIGIAIGKVLSTKKDENTDGKKRSGKEKRFRNFCYWLWATLGYALLHKNTIGNIIKGKGDKDSEGSKNSAKLLVQEAEVFGKVIKNGGLTTAQIRNIFGTVKKLENKLAQREDKDENFKSKIGDPLILLKPKLAYAAARHKRKPGLTALTNVLSDAIDLVKSKEDFERFVNFFEAILAYHRAAGGK